MSKETSNAKVLLNDGRILDFTVDAWGANDGWPLLRELMSKTDREQVAVVHFRRCEDGGVYRWTPGKLDVIAAAYAAADMSMDDELFSAVDVAIQIPEDAQYQFDPATNLATITIEVGSGLPGQVEYAHVTARLSAFDEAEGGLTAEYVSHEGDATAEEIDYACRAIETNDLGV